MNALDEFYSELDCFQKHNEGKPPRRVKLSRSFLRRLSSEIGEPVRGIYICGIPLKRIADIEFKP